MANRLKVADINAISLYLALMLVSFPCEHRKKAYL